MKNKLFLLYAVLLTAFTLSAHAQQKGTWGSDVVISPNSGRTYKDAKIAVAYDGSIFVARMSAPAGTTNYDLVEVRVSVDSGKHWSLFSSIPFTVTLNSIDICAAGNTSTSFRLFLAVGSYGAVAGTPYSQGYLRLFSFIAGGNYTQETLPNEYIFTGYGKGYISVALATDSRKTSSTAGDYSIALAAINDFKDANGNAEDSIICWVRRASASSYTRRAMYGTTSYLRNVSAAIGSAASTVSQLGRLGVAWDEFTSPTTSFGIIKVMYGYGSNGGSVPYGGPYTMNLTAACRAPAISLSQVTSGAGSGDIRTMLAYEYLAASGIEINGRVADSIITRAPNFSASPVIAAGTGTQDHAHIAYDPGANNFLITYYNAAAQRLAYKIKGRNTPPADTPVTVIANYRDANTPSSITINPRVDINPATSQAVFVWNDNGATLFDAGYAAPTSLHEASPTLHDISLFPNPAHEEVCLAFTADDAEDARYTVSDVTGRSLLSGAYAMVRGANRLSIPLGSLPAGTYLVQLQGTTVHAARSLQFSKEALFFR